MAKVPYNDEPDHDDYNNYQYKKDNKKSQFVVNYVTVPHDFEREESMTVRENLMFLPTQSKIIKGCRTADDAIGSLLDNNPSMFLNAKGEQCNKEYQKGIYILSVEDNSVAT